MRIAHVLRRYEPGEWGGVETALLQSLNSLRDREVTSFVFCPRSGGVDGLDPIATAGHSIQCFRACLPIWGLPADKRRELIALGGNLLPFDLAHALRLTPALDLIHTYTQGKIGAISRRVAHLLHIPCVVTSYGGAVDLHESISAALARRPVWSCEWGCLFNLILRTRRLLDKVDAIIIRNPAEEGLLRERYPHQRIYFHPYGVALARYEIDFRPQAEAAFPQIKNRTVLLCPARIHPTKNQQWLLYQLPTILSAYPNALVVLAGAYSDEHYGNMLQQHIDQTGLTSAVLMTGALAPDDPRLVGLFQHGKALVLPSLVETIGVAILEAWAAGVPVIANRTSVASALIHHNEEGWLFDLFHPQTLHEGLGHVLSNPSVADRFAAAGRRRVQAEFDSRQLSSKLKSVYEELIDIRSVPPRRSEKKSRRLHAK